MSGDTQNASLIDDFIWIRSETLSTLLCGISIILWLWILMYATRPASFWPGWAVPLAIMGAVAVSFVAKGFSYFLAAAIFILALFSGPILVLITPDQREIAPFLFVVPVLVAGTLGGTFAAVGIAAVSSLVIGGIGLFMPIVLDSSNILGGLALIWITALTAWASTRSLYIALHWAWSNSEQATYHLDEARRYQAELSSALRQLEEATYRLEQANHALAWARAEAEAAKNVKAQFAAHVSHELRTPINLIVGFAELMLNAPEVYGSSPLPKPYVADLTALVRSAKHLQGLIDDILDLSQIEAGEMPVLRDPTDIGTIIREAVATTSRLIESKGLSVFIEIANDLPLLRVDRLRIRQVLLNLISNSVRFTDQGSIRIRAFRDSGQIVIEVSDTGLGIAPDDLAKVFEPFHQAGEGTKRRRGGTGLGLAISKRFLELHGGTMQVTSTGIPGQGTTFICTLPIEFDESDLRSNNDPTRTHLEIERLVCPPPPPTVIVVDDDPAVIGLFQRYLKAYRVVGAASVDEGIALGVRLRAHALITDLPIAEDSSLWHCFWSRNAELHGLRVLGCPLPSGRRLARTIGLADYLVKPITREMLLQSVDYFTNPNSTILVVDDDVQMVRLLCRMLRSSPKGYNLLRATGGEQALELMRCSRPDLVLLDVYMPQVDGISVLEQMRRDPELATIPVVAVSARGRFEAITPSAARSLTLINDKMLSVSGLLATIQGILEALPPSVAPDLVNGSR